MRKCIINIDFNSQTGFLGSTKVYIVLLLSFVAASCNGKNGSTSEKHKVSEKESILNAKDSIGIRDSVDAITGNHIYTEYTADGTRMRKWEEGGANGGLATLWEERYNKKGGLEKRTEFEYSSGTTYDETHIISKTIEFYPNGLIKSKIFQESFMMGEKCDCGLWEFFDESGKIIKKDQKQGDCEDFDLDCL